MNTRFKNKTVLVFFAFFFCSFFFFILNIYTVNGPATELLRKLKYFGFSQLILGCKQLLQLKLRDINDKYMKYVGHSIVNASAQ